MKIKKIKYTCILAPEEEFTSRLVENQTMFFCQSCGDWTPKSGNSQHLIEGSEKFPLNTKS